MLETTNEERDLLEELKRTLLESHEYYKELRESGIKGLKYYNNDEMIDDVKTLEAYNLKRPSATSNIVRLYANVTLGQNSEKMTSIKVTPVRAEDLTAATLLNDTVKQISKNVDDKVQTELVKKDLILTGIGVGRIQSVKLEEKDEYGRDYYATTFERVSSLLCFLDPKSKKPDYTDANYIHEIKSYTYKELVDKFGKSKASQIAVYNSDWAYEYVRLDPYLRGDFWRNSLDGSLRGTYKGNELNLVNQYTLITSEIKLQNKALRIIWYEDTIVEETDISYTPFNSTYVVSRLNIENDQHAKGAFEPIYKIQDAITHAYHLMLSSLRSSKIVVPEGDVPYNDEAAMLASLEGDTRTVVVASDSKGVSVLNENMDFSKYIQAIDFLTEEARKILGIPRARLGETYAAESGRKVKLDQQTSVTNFMHMSNAIDSFFRRVGLLIVTHIQHYYTATQVLAVADETTKMQWLQLNMPDTYNELDKETGQVNQKPVLMPYIDPDTGKIVKNAGGEVMVPQPTFDSAIGEIEVKVDITAVNYNGEDDNIQRLLDMVVNGNAGTVLAQTDAASYLKVVATLIESMKLKDGFAVATLFKEAIQKAEIYSQDNVVKALLDTEQQKAALMQMQQGQQDPRAGSGGGRNQTQPSSMSGGGVSYGLNQNQEVYNG